jgi:solute carrier family 39 (zinc transporter), member 1/2/3
MDPRLQFSILSAFVLLAIALLGSWLPLRLARYSRGSSGHGMAANHAGWANTAYHLGNCLSGGVMLSASFCHLLADALPGLAFVGRFPMVRGTLCGIVLQSVLGSLPNTEVRSRCCAATFL